MRFNPRPRRVLLVTAAATLLLVGCTDDANGDDDGFDANRQTSLPDDPGPTDTSEPQDPGAPDDDGGTPSTVQGSTAGPGGGGAGASSNDEWNSPTDGRPGG
ncbi:MAG: hypothetical protein ACK4V6_01960 [Microthrixaceae bacterium]